MTPLLPTEVQKPNQGRNYPALLRELLYNLL